MNAARKDDTAGEAELIFIDVFCNIVKTCSSELMPISGVRSFLTSESDLSKTVSETSLLKSLPHKEVKRQHARMFLNSFYSVSKKQKLAVFAWLDKLQPGKLGSYILLTQYFHLVKYFMNRNFSLSSTCIVSRVESRSI